MQWIQWHFWIEYHDNVNCNKAATSVGFDSPCFLASKVLLVSHAMLLSPCIWWRANFCQCVWIWNNSQKRAPFGGYSAADIPNSSSASHAQCLRVPGCVAQPYLLAELHSYAQRRCLGVFQVCDARPSNFDKRRASIVRAELGAKPYTVD